MSDWMDYIVPFVVLVLWILGAKEASKKRKKPSSKEITPPVSIDQQTLPKEYKRLAQEAADILRGKPSPIIIEAPTYEKEVIVLPSPKMQDPSPKQASINPWVLMEKQSPSARAFLCHEVFGPPKAYRKK